MFNFQDALKEGLSHAEEEQKNRKEIDSVFDALKDDIEGFTKSNVSIKLCKRIDAQIGDGHDLIASALGSILNTRKRRKYLGLIAYRTLDSAPFEKELCEWEYGEKGYPVTISYLNRSTACADKESLILCLQDLLSHPDAGKKIKSLIDKTAQT
jgi:hypothetical protein